MKKYSWHINIGDHGPPIDDTVLERIAHEAHGSRLLAQYLDRFGPFEIMCSPNHRSLSISGIPVITHDAKAVT